MKRIASWLTAVLVVACLAGPAWSEDEGGRGKGAGRRQGGRQARRETRRENAGQREQVRQRIGQALTDAGLSEEQIAQVREIMAEHRKAVMEHRKANAEKFAAARKKMVEARENEDREAAEKAMDEMRELAEARRDLAESLREKLGKVLTEQQMDKLRALRPDGRGRRGGRRGEGPLSRLNLTDEQRARAEEILSGAEKGERRAAMKKVYDEVLTDEQRQQLGERRRQRAGRGGHPGGRLMTGLDLTDEQKAEIRKIMESAGDGDRREAMKKVIDEVLTDQQREKVRQRLQQHRRRRGGRDGQDDEEPDDAL